MKGFQRQGFTIVELLIVVVVIAILAAITIVAYNGITNQAKNSAAQAAATQATKKIMAYAALNSDQYPVTLADAGIANNDGALQYTGGGSTFCVTATQQNISYYQSNSTNVARGACFGHNKDGVTIIANLAVNPSVEADMSNWTSRWFGPGGAGSTVRAAAAAICGTNGVRKTWTANGGGQDIGFSTNVQNVIPGRQYSFSVSMRSSLATAYRAWVEWYNSGGKLSGDATMVSEVAVAANTWQRLASTSTAPAGATMAFFIFGPYPATGSPTFTAGATLDADCLMITQTAQPQNYADGETNGWTWSGTRYNSASSGAPQ